jgi:hypothetical protein
MKEKVVVLRELQRTIIYTNELNKQAMECHVSRAFIVYSVNEGARLTSYSIAAVNHESVQGEYASVAGVVMVPLNPPLR